MRRVAPARAGEGTVRENTAPPRPHELHTTPLGAARLCKNLGFAPQDVMRQCIRCIAQPGAVYQRRGNHVFIGPNVGIYTVTHALLPDQRNAGVMRSLPITIGDNVWIGGNCVVMQGVTIGDGTVIGAGSVVTRDIPAGVIAFGNPCRVIRPVTEDDRITEVV